jgi:hypothetical protein
VAAIATYLWLISLPCLFLLYRGLWKRKELTTEERLLAWFGIVLLMVSVGFQAMDWLSITPVFLLPYASSVGYVLAIVAVVLLAVFVVIHRRTAFRAEIVGEKNVQLGESLRLRVWYKGQLQRGLFTSKIVPPKGQTLRNTGKPYVWWPCKRTFLSTKGKSIGLLAGKGPFEKTWDCDKIPFDYPTGNYVASVRVYDQAVSESEPIKEQNITFSVTRRSGWSIQTAFERLLHGSDSVTSG